MQPTQIGSPTHRDTQSPTRIDPELRARVSHEHFQVWPPNKQTKTNSIIPGNRTLEQAVQQVRGSSLACGQSRPQPWHPPQGPRTLPGVIPEYSQMWPSQNFNYTSFSHLQTGTKGKQIQLPYLMMGAITHPLSKTSWHLFINIYDMHYVNMNHKFIDL